MTQSKEWRYDIQYGPDGEANYAWVYNDKGEMVCTTKTHHAISIVDRFNAAINPSFPADPLPGSEESPGGMKTLPPFPLGDSDIGGS